jgi:hypothetical protein
MLEVRARITQLFWRGAQLSIGQSRQSRQSRWVGFPVGYCLQHAPRTGAQQIRDEAGQLNVGLFQQRLQLVLQPHVIARQLVFSPRHHPPQTLLGIGHKAQGQLLCHHPPLKLVLVFDFHVGHNYSQHLLVDIDSRCKA